MKPILFRNKRKYVTLRQNKDKLFFRLIWLFLPFNLTNSLVPKTQRFVSPFYPPPLPPPPNITFIQRNRNFVNEFRLVTKPRPRRWIFHQILHLPHKGGLSFLLHPVNTATLSQCFGTRIIGKKYFIRRLIEKLSTVSGNYGNNQSSLNYYSFYLLNQTKKWLHLNKYSLIYQKIMRSGVVSYGTYL